MGNPIISAVADIVANVDRPITSVSVYMVADATLLSIIWADFRRADYDKTRGVEMTIRERRPDTVVPINIAGHRQIVAAAWWQGAWDVVRTVIGGGHPGPFPPPIEAFADQAHRHGYATWTWRPMLFGPPTRIKAFAHRDATLDPLTLARSGPAPSVRIRPAKPNSQLEITLGRAP